MSIGYGLGHKVTSDIADIDDVDELSDGELVEIAVEAGGNHGRGIVYRFQYEIDGNDVIITRQGRTSGPNIIYEIGTATVAHHERSYPKINYSDVVSVDWKVTFGEGGMDIDVGSDSDSIKTYTPSTLDPEYYRDLTSELADKGDIDHDELLALAFDELPQDNGGETTGEGTNHHWILASPSIWEVESIEDGDEVFYTAYNQKGNKRRILGAFEEVSPGDKVLFYESQPVQAIVAEGTIQEGLHKDEHEEYDEPTDRITIEYSRTTETISQDQLTVVPDLEGASPIRNRAQGSLFPLTEDEFETVPALKDPIEDGVSQNIINQLETKLISPEVDVSIPSSFHFDDADRPRRGIEASLRSGEYLIFTGPPGAGKIRLTEAICESAAARE